jgi:translocation and assembly module TamB
LTPTAINSVSLDGKFTSRTLEINLPQARAAAQNLEGKYALHQGVLDASNLQADALGGRVSAHLIIRQLATVAAAQLDAEAKGVSLTAIRSALPAQNRTPVRIDGRMDGNMRANWHGSMEGAQLLSNATMSGSISPAENSTGHSSSFPIKAAVHAAYDAPKQLLTLHDSSMDTPHSHLSLDGVLGGSANLQIEARSGDLREIDLLALAFRPNAPDSNKAASSAPPQLLGLGGSATVRGTVSGQLANPHFAGQFAATNLQVHGASMQSLQANIQASAAGVAAHDGTIRNGSRGQVNFDISLGLRDWSPAPDQSVAARLTASALSIADIEHIAGFQYPISGVIAANVTISGTEETPNAQGNIHLTQAILWQQPIQDANIDLKTSGDSLLTSMTLRTSAGNATTTLAYNPKSQDYDLQASLQAIRLNQVKYLQDHAQSVTGVLNISAQGHGNIKAPQLEMTVNSQQLKIGEQAIEGFAAQTSVSQGHAAFDVKGSVSGAVLQAQGTVNLSGDHQVNAKIDSEAIQLDEALASFLPQGGADFHGQTQFHGALAGPLKDPDQLEAHLEFPSFNVAYGQIQLAAATPIHIDYQRGLWTVQRTELKGTGTDVTVEASVPLSGAANLQATANGKLDLRLLQIWNPDWQSSGEVTLNVGARGDRAHPVMSGTLSVSDGAIAIENAPALEKITGELDVTGDRIQVKTLTAQLGGGDVEVHGFAIYRPSMQYNLGVTAREVRLLYPAGVRTQLTATLNFAGRPDDANLTGQVSINRLSLTQSFDLASFSNAFGGPSSPPTGMAQNVKLNVAVSSRQELELSSSQLSIQGTADFRVRGTLAEPVLIGRTDLTGGELFFNARRFQIQNASIQFANPVRTEPIVNLTATTTVDQFNLTVNLVGPFDRLRTTYTSDPPLPPVDVINLLISGQTTEAAQGSTTSPQSVIAGQLTGQVSNRLQKLTGISSLTIDPQIGGNQGNAASQLAIQERVTKNLFFTFATDVTTTQGVVVQVEYQITPKYSMSAVRDQTGGYEIEIKARKKF